MSLRIKLVIEREGYIVMQETGTTLDTCRCRDAAAITRIAVKGIVDVETNPGLVLEEFVINAGIQQKTIGIHQVSHVTTIQQERGKERESP